MLLAALAAFLLLSKGHARYPQCALGVVLTLAGTGSSTFNGLVPGYVRDYLRVPFTGLAFNLAGIFALLRFALACAVVAAGQRPIQARAN